MRPLLFSVTLYGGKQINFHKKKSYAGWQRLLPNYSIWSQICYHLVDRAAIYMSQKLLVIDKSGLRITSMRDKCTTTHTSLMPLA